MNVMSNIDFLTRLKLIENIKKTFNPNIIDLTDETSIQKFNLISCINNVETYLDYIDELILKYVGSNTIIIIFKTMSNTLYFQQTSKTYTNVAFFYGTRFTSMKINVFNAYVLNKIGLLLNKLICEDDNICCVCYDIQNFGLNCDECFVKTCWNCIFEIVKSKAQKTIDIIGVKSIEDLTRLKNIADYIKHTCCPACRSDLSLMIA